MIRARNESEYLGATLDRVFSQYLSNFEVIVIDSGSTDRTVDIARQYATTVIETEPQDFSYGRALNLGAERARAQHVVYLSAHSEPLHRDWLGRLLENFNRGDIAGVYGKQIPRPRCNPLSRRSDFGLFGNEKRVQAEGTWFSNANAAIRKQVWRQVPFDEKLPYAEDADWARRVLDKGYKLVYEPQAAVYHSHDESLFQAYNSSFIANMGARHLASYKPGPLRLGLATCHEILLDFRYLLERRENISWFLYSPLYRTARAWGKYRGQRVGVSGG